MNRIKSSLKVIMLFLLSLEVNGQIQLTDNIYYADEDITIFNRFLTEMESKKSLPMDQLIVETGMFFLGTPYVASTLEHEPEGLVVNFREMDCSTFVDNVIALARMLKSDDHSFDSFCKQLQNLRYRNGKINDYADRLHYTSDWVYENDRKKIVRDINKEIGGLPLQLSLSFMSTHPDSYKQLKTDMEMVRQIAEIEKDISSRSYYYIPKQHLEGFDTKIKSGDIVCFTTAIKGLDTSHVGIITRNNGKLTFIHASSLAKKVIINEASLKEYVNRGKNSTGILLARPLHF